MSQGRYVFLGYQSSYQHAYKAELDYLDSTSTTQTFSTGAFSQAPGVVFEIPDCMQVTAIRIYDAVTNIIISQFNSFSDVCTSPCWSSSSMAGTMAMQITWDPSQRIIVTNDNNVIGPKPGDSK
jgi:hypothetical protein